MNNLQDTKNSQPDNTAKLYEELRSIIDGGSESFTHEDAVQYLKDKLAQPAVTESHKQEPVAMRTPKVGDKVVCIEDDSLGMVAYLTAGGSPEIRFDDGSHGTYLLREFAKLFRYTTPPQPKELEQEPVVGTKTWFEDGNVVTQHLTAKDIYKEPEQEEYLSKAYRLANELRCHLAIAPAPQRTWVGLTDEEREAVINNSMTPACVAIAIEAKLKENNT